MTKGKPCAWCGTECNHRKGRQSVFCQSVGNKCKYDHYASQKGDWGTLDAICLLIDQGFECVGCCRVLPPDLFDPDHIIAKATGGNNKLGNMQMICTSCNRGKGKKKMREFLDNGLKWSGGPCMTHRHGELAMIFYCNHKRIGERCTAMLSGRVKPHSKTEMWAAKRILEWLADQEKSVIQSANGYSI